MERFLKLILSFFFFLFFVFASPVLGRWGDLATPSSRTVHQERVQERLQEIRKKVKERIREHRATTAARLSERRKRRIKMFLVV